MKALIAYTVSDGFNRLISENVEHMNVQVIPLSRINTINEQDFIHDFDNYTNTSFACFDLTLDHDKKIARFFNTDIVLHPDLRGYGLASYATGKLIAWAQSKKTDYRVEHIKLGRGDAESDEARDNRNNYYTNLGFELDFSNDPECRTGHTKACSIHTLRPMIKHPRIMVYANPSEPISKLLLDREEWKSKFNQAVKYNNELEKELISIQKFYSRYNIYIAGLLFIIMVGIGVSIA
jgi:hypothetical protein